MSLKYSDTHSRVLVVRLVWLRKHHNTLMYRCPNHSCNGQLYAWRRFPITRIVRGAGLCGSRRFKSMSIVSLREGRNCSAFRKYPAASRICIVRMYLYSNITVLFLRCHICATGALQESNALSSFACVTADGSTSGPLLFQAALVLGSEALASYSPSAT
jgi:hypothetical protein